MKKSLFIIYIFFSSVVLLFSQNGNVNLDTILEKYTKNANAIGSPFVIQRYGIKNINSAGGVAIDFNIKFINIDRRVKYLYFTVIGYNRVGDIVYDTIDGNSKHTFRHTGWLPTKYGDTIFTEAYCGWNNCWYNYDTSYIKLIELKIVWENNSEIVISKQDDFESIIFSKSEYDFWKKNANHDDGR
jgi:hypothetical protein